MAGEFVKTCVALCSALVASACVTTQEPVSKTVNAQGDAVAASQAAGADTRNEELGVSIGRLPAQKLKEGECGLFLFRGKPTPDFIFFAEASSGMAIMLLNGEEVVFDRMTSEGEVFDMHSTEQTYAEQAGSLSLLVSVTPGEQTIGGHEIAKGTIHLSREGGWKMVIPVGGATTCGVS